MTTIQVYTNSTANGSTLLWTSGNITLDSSTKVQVKVADSFESILTTQTPSNMAQGNQACEVGTRFKSTVSGKIYGGKFYKSPSETGTSRNVHLWDNSGNLLATATTSNESASGWQSANFGTPISITAGTKYVISYNSNAAFVSLQHVFDSDVTNGHLVGCATDPNNGVGISNGLFSSAGSPNVFPTYSYSGVCFFVDVLFVPNATESIFTTQTPSNMAQGNQACEVGTRFKSTVDGKICGGRFYKSPSETGTSRNVHLWDNSGNLLATATTSNESASGWQSVNFSSPISITAGTKYVISYNSNAAFVSTQHIFDSDVTNGHLVGCATDANNTAGICNGLFSNAGSPNVFPAYSYSGVCFFVDVLFIPN